MTSSILKYRNKIYILVLLTFSIIINQYYGNRGTFPMDSFHFFDSGYRILNGSIPFVDYWLIKGPLLDYMSAIFFYLFGVNWQAYVFQASLINAILTLSTFFILKNFKLNINFCFFYSLLLSVLAYPSSGTPFIDHHSAFISLLAVYCFFFAINTQKNFYWILMPILFGFAFLSKQVPAGYLIIFIFLVTIFYVVKNKKLSVIKNCLLGTLIFISLFLVFCKTQGILISAFFDQYIFYPQTVGKERFVDYNFTFSGIVEHFIFIYLAIFFLVYVNLKKLFNEKNYTKKNDFYSFLTLTCLTFSLILHQILTKNQTFIFFLIPILSAFSHISLNLSNLKFKKAITFFIIIICLFSTFKYHLRFNENRKFHELIGANFELVINANKIDNRLAGLKWITPQFKNDPKKEIDLINKIKLILKSDNRSKMIITNYPFFSVILDQDVFAPSRIYTGDGTTHPIKGNKYVSKYQELMDNLIKRNEISVIYVINTANENNNFHYIDLYKNCYEKFSLIQQLTSYELKNCI